MAVPISFTIPVPFSEWVTSAKHYWIIFAARRREGVDQEENGLQERRGVPVKTTAREPDGMPPIAMRNPLRIGPGTTRKILRLQFSVETAPGTGRNAA